MIDLKKTYRTRDGRDVRLYANDGGGSYPIHGAFFDATRWWVSCTWTDDGHASVNDRRLDLLIEVRPERWYPILLSEDPVHRYYIGRLAYPTREFAIASMGALDAWKAPD